MTSVLVFFVLVILVDLYTYKGLKTLTNQPEKVVFKLFLRVLFWLIPSILLASIIFVIYFKPDEPTPKIFNGYFYIIAFTLMFYLPKLLFIIFHFLEDFVLMVEKSFMKVKGYFNKTFISFNDINPKRRKFLSRTGLIIAIIPFIAIIYGMAIGRFDFQVINKTIELQKLPASFDGFRIVQISDLHIGSFYGYEQRVKQAVEIVNSQDPDMIVFTGDLVNNFTAELDNFTDILSELNAPYGKFSILGNHDYGDYYQWESDEAKERNMQDMFVAQEKIGFRLLLNQWDTILVNGESIALIGVENWGEPPFPRYGDLDKASSGTDNIPVKILLSHDPSHWDAEVLVKTDIDLTLAGHTHGMQLGIENRFFRWSPSKIKYPRWGGLFEENGQFLYVNRGLGFIAFPGRIGMPPEITVIELRRAR